MSDLDKPHKHRQRSMSNRTNNTRILKAAKQYALEAGAILKKGFNLKKRIAYKGRIDPVTEYDLKSEKYLVGQIKSHFPDHTILAEEGSTALATADSDYRWVLDPLDGTVNYARGFPMYCVSIGVEHQGEPVVGVVYDPEREELFYAAKGKGAFLNGRRIHVSNEKRLDRALLATGFAYDIGTARKNNLGLFARMAKKAQGIRRPGSAALDLCWVATGRMDGFWELRLHPWDTAAALVIIAEAGGKYSRIRGEKFSIHDQDLLVSNGFLHRQMQKVLTGQ